VLKVVIRSTSQVDVPSVRVQPDGEIIVFVPERNDDVAEAMDAAQAVIRHFYERPD
jgi:hypothetical protein